MKIIMVVVICRYIIHMVGEKEEKKELITNSLFIFIYDTCSVHVIVLFTDHLVILRLHEWRHMRVGGRQRHDRTLHDWSGIQQRIATRQQQRWDKRWNDSAIHCDQIATFVQLH